MNFTTINEGLAEVRENLESLREESLESSELAQLEDSFERFEELENEVKLMEEPTNSVEVQALYSKLDGLTRDFASQLGSLKEELADIDVLEDVETSLTELASVMSLEWEKDVASFNVAVDDNMEHAFDLDYEVTPTGYEFMDDTRNISDNEIVSALDEIAQETDLGRLTELSQGEVEFEHDTDLERGI